MHVRGVHHIGVAVTDLDEAWNQGLSNHAAGELLGGGPGDVPDRYAAASPARLLPLGVPQLLFHGAYDDAVPLDLTTSYGDAALAAGDEARVVIIPEADHFDIVDPLSPCWPGIRDAVCNLLGITDR